MACKFGSRKDENGNEITFFQCTPGEFEYMQERSKQPYEDDECRHNRRFVHSGVLTCQDCGATYDEKTLTWINY